MKVYCKNCHTEIKQGDGVRFNEDFDNHECPFCFIRDIKLKKIPMYETPAQYEKRTGEEWLDASPVFYREFSARCEWGRWHVADYYNAKHYDKTSRWTVQIVIADPPVPPPDDWEPEVIAPDKNKNCANCNNKNTCYSENWFLHNPGGVIPNNATCKNWKEDTNG